MNTIPGFAAEATLYETAGRSYASRGRVQPRSAVYAAQHLAHLIDSVPLPCPAGTVQRCRQECQGQLIQQCDSWDWQPLDPSNPSPWGRWICRGSAELCTEPGWREVCECQPIALFSRA
jgi:hypothetical protein